MNELANFNSYFKEYIIVHYSHYNLVFIPSPSCYQDLSSPGILLINRRISALHISKSSRETMWSKIRPFVSMLEETTSCFRPQQKCIIITPLFTHTCTLVYSCTYIYTNTKWQNCVTAKFIYNWDS